GEPKQHRSTARRTADRGVSPPRRADSVSARARLVRAGFLRRRLLRGAVGAHTWVRGARRAAAARVRRRSLGAQYGAIVAHICLLLHRLLHGSGTAPPP